MPLFFMWVLLCACVYSQQPVTITLADFSGGLHSRASARTIPANASPELYNVATDIDATLTSYRFPGLIGNFPMGGPIIGGTYFRTTTGEGIFIVQRYGTVYASYNGLEWVPIVTGLAYNYPCTYVSVDGVLVISNGIDPVGVYDGVTYSSYAYIPRGRTMATHAGSLWVSGISGEPDAVYFSKPGYPITTDTAWDPSYSLFVQTRDGDRITTIIPYQSKLYVFKNRSMHMIVPNGDQSILYTISPTIGCPHPYTVSHHGGLLVWLGHDGVYTSDGLRVTRISEHIDPTMNTIRQLSVPDRVHVGINYDADFKRGSGADYVVEAQGVWPYRFRAMWSGETLQGSYTNMTRANDTIYLSTVAYYGEESIGFVVTSVPSIIPGVPSLTPLTDGDLSSSVIIPMTVEYMSLPRSATIKSPSPMTYGWWLRSGTPEIQLRCTLPAEVSLSRVSIYQSTLDGGFLDVSAHPTIPRPNATVTFEIQTRNPYTGQYDQTGPMYPVSVYWPGMMTASQQLYRVWHPECDRHMLMQTASGESLVWWCNKDGAGVWDGVPWYTQSQYHANKVQESYTYAPGTRVSEVLLTYRMLPITTSGYEQRANIAVNEIQIYQSVPGVQHVSSGRYITTAFDSYCTTPRYGRVTIDQSTYSATVIQWYAQTSENNSVWSASFPVVNGYDLSTSSIPHQRYIRFIAEVGTTNNSVSPIIRGIWVDGCKSPAVYVTPVMTSRNVHTWDYFTTSQSTYGAHISWSVRASTWAGGLSLSSWQPIDRNTTPPLPTGPNIYMQYRATITVTSPTPAPWISGIEVSWYPSQPCTRAVGLSDGRRYYISVSTGPEVNNAIIYYYGGGWNMVSGRQITAMVHTGTSVLWIEQGGNIYSTTDPSGDVFPVLWTSKIIEPYQYIKSRIQRIGITCWASSTATVNVLVRSADASDNWSTIPITVAPTMATIQVPVSLPDSVSWQVGIATPYSLDNPVLKIRDITLYLIPTAEVKP